MRWFRLTASMAAKVRALIEQAEVASATDPALCQVAGEVYVGDIYVLRDDVKAGGNDDGWGKRCYVCNSGVPLL